MTNDTISRGKGIARCAHCHKPHLATFHHTTLAWRGETDYFAAICPEDGKLRFICETDVHFTDDDRD